MQGRPILSRVRVGHGVVDSLEERLSESEILLDSPGLVQSCSCCSIMREEDAEAATERHQYRSSEWSAGFEYADEDAGKSPLLIAQPFQLPTKP